MKGADVGHVTYCARCFVDPCCCAQASDNLARHAVKGSASAVFESGAKSSEAKPRYDLIPLVALAREAVRMAEGAAAHGENNYRKGKADQRFVQDRINHLLEHALKYADGDRSDDHLAAIRCNAGMLMWLES